MSEETPVKAAISSVSWLTAAMKFITALESILPAVLVAWVNSQKNKNALLAGKLQLEKIKTATLEREINDKQNNNAFNTVGSFLERRRGTKPPPQ